MREPIRGSQTAATVSNAFNRPDQLSSKLRNKILATARALNYSGPNPAARMLRTGFSHTIAVVYPYPLRRPFEDAAAAAFLGEWLTRVQTKISPYFSCKGEKSL